MTEQRRTSRVAQKRERAQRKKQMKTPSQTWVKRILQIVAILVIAGFIGGASLFAYYVSSAPELDEELLKDPLSSEFYDKNGEVFATIGVQNRLYVKYEDIPKEMIDAILATEDVRFFEHGGMDFYRLGGAILANFRDGFGAQGASTITQQVVKNSFLQNKKKLKRKAQEAWLAFQLERKYEKEEIFEMYFNKVLMSGRIYGFGTAAQYFYGKELKDLTLDEMALLAGMPQSPNNYNPLKNPDLAEKRRNIVLSLMVQHEKISKTQMDEAKTVDVSENLSSDDQRQQFAGTKYDAFLDVVLTEIENNDDGESLAEGIKVYTTLDPDAQKIVESILNNDANFPTAEIQAGVAVIDTKTGAIQAVGGGRNYGAERGFNFAEDMKKRSPGSTIKPLLDYGPAIEYLKWSTGKTTVDDRTTYSNSSQAISNWDGKYLGAMSVREALYSSRNVPAVKTLREVGTDNAQQFINQLGIEADVIHESDAIGGGNITMTPIQMAASYAAFGNGGVYTDPHAVLKIVYRDGTSSKTYKNKSVAAMSDYTAYMVTDILRDVVSNKPGASGSAAKVSGLDMAGKTGTTNYSNDDFSRFNLPDTSVPDAWFAGYTSNYSIAIWSGYFEYSDPITTWDERRLPQNLFKYIMTDLAAKTDTPTFTQPNSVVRATVEIGTSPLQLASEFTPDYLRQTELFVRGTEPSQTSATYEETALNAPTNVQANYDEMSKSLALTWEHQLPEPREGEDPLQVKYEISLTVDDGTTMIVAETDTLSATIPITQAGNNYTLSVVAISGDIRSEAGTVSIYIDNTEGEQPTPENPIIPIPETPTEDNNTTDPNTTDENNNNDGGVIPPTEPVPPSNVENNNTN